MRLGITHEETLISFFKLLFIYFWLCWICVAAWAFLQSKWDLSLAVVYALLIAVAFLVAEHGLQQWWRTDLAALQHVEPSRIRD